MKFFKRLRVILSFPDPHEIVTKKWTWIELCQNAVFSRPLGLSLNLQHQELYVWYFANNLRENKEILHVWI